MKTVNKLAIAVALVVYGSASFADASRSQEIKQEAPKGITAAFYACITKANDPTSSGACLSAEKTRQDARLNTTYKALMAKLTGKAKDDLVNAERAWVDLEDKTGRFETSLYGDETVADLQVTQNEIFRICERANALDKYLSVANTLL
ncbi:uncharacterized protein YecT (DUF1311 family) [Luteibacter sp. Sphag1AF]|uniref:lysozyme inhibitor LprI family protein n=1 Tax=Luteibacter sp. Sphag1AF TaxID=2587031 RepID=UPI00161EDCF5|nr:lysozyme inhibitor LprI family protein [Luteibacter sp. Sphag1AF]MBB3227120.1 uncharacterized protein YecT (DUF1311 family) [Luteibacter sp. Sphag1AF]